MARFPRVVPFSSAESGSGEPPDRAQICPCDDVVLYIQIFFSEAILGPPEWTFGRGNEKKDSKLSASTSH